MFLILIELLIQNQVMKKLPILLLIFVLSNTLLTAQINHVLPAEADSIDQKSSNVPPPLPYRR